MKICTTYFANLKRLPPHIVPISICGKAPKGYTGIQYKTLAPKYGFFMEWKQNQDNDFYIEHFNAEVLDHLDPAQVLKHLETMSGGQDVALVCYEKPGDFCHRHLVAKWFNEKLGLDVKEYEA